MNRTTALRALHDVGAAAWFGGALMGVVGLNAAADQVGDPADRDRVAAAGWARWTPVFRAAAGAHLLGSVGLLAKSRSRGAALDLGLTAAAVGTVAGAAVLGGRAGSKQAVRSLEWATPVLLAGVILRGARG
ncbi:MAG: hypothetical protein OJJ54_24550 [Pseudonocardia sp.]|nr:hypothetical protein [Pseudonocardia sp.]